MPLPIEWSPRAHKQLTGIISYIASDNPNAAISLRDRIEGAVTPLAEHPYLFRPGRVAGTRELVAHPNYIIIYSVLADRVRILSILHSRRQYP